MITIDILIIVFSATTASNSTSESSVSKNGPFCMNIISSMRSTSIAACVIAGVSLVLEFIYAILIFCKAKVSVFIPGFAAMILFSLIPVNGMVLGDRHFIGGISECSIDFSALCPTLSLVFSIFGFIFAAACAGVSGRCNSAKATDSSSSTIVPQNPVGVAATPDPNQSAITPGQTPTRYTQAEASQPLIYAVNQGNDLNYGSAPPYEVPPYES